MRQTRRISRRFRKQRRSKNQKYTKLVRSRTKQTKVRKLGKSRKKQTKKYSRKSGNITSNIINTYDVEKIKGYLNDLDNIIRLPDDDKLKISAHLSNIARSLESELEHIEKGNIIHVRTTFDKNYLELTSNYIFNTVTVKRTSEEVYFPGVRLLSFKI